MDVTKPRKIIGFGAMDVTKPYKFTKLGAKDATKPYKFIGFGAMDATKPYKIIGFGAVASLHCTRRARKGVRNLGSLTKRCDAASVFNQFTLISPRQH